MVLPECPPPLILSILAVCVPLTWLIQVSPINLLCQPRLFVVFCHVPIVDGETQ
ncbi:hypothetical protein CGRA01v4_08030 [Colletotrichum graminicola]|nr:hypothetical protein CGRA01v4_08030 [Colletotrichum graminicola]